MINIRLYTLLYLLLTTVFFSHASFATSQHFSPDSQPNLGMLTDFKGSDLCIVAENTQGYLTKQPQDLLAVHAGKVFGGEVTLERVKQSLNFICQTYREDVRAKRQSRLHNADFLRQNFDFFRWMPDKVSATEIAKKSTNATKSRMLNNIPDDEIFVTKYYTKLLKGSEVKTAEFDQALYAIPYDEQHLPLVQANQQPQITRLRYSRQQVIAGALLEHRLAKPLVWLSEESLHDVLLQGTGVLNVDGEVHYYNVHRNNGISYDYSIGKRDQARYWYFAKVPAIMGYGDQLMNKIAIKPQVTFAGNVAELGLGKLIMINYQKNKQQVSRMGILADTGGAFDNNLFQLDLLVDSYYGWQDYHQANKHLPDYASAWLMLLKE